MECTPRKVSYKYALRSSPLWKDAYRKRCYDRWKKSRASLIDKYRSTGISRNDSPKRVAEIMKQEWDSDGNLCTYPGFDNSFVENDDDEVLELLEDIKSELLEKEEMLLNEVINYDAKALDFQISLLQSEEIICPVCQLNNLKVVEGKLFSLSSDSSKCVSCGCGFCFSGNSVSLEGVKSSLENTVEQHSLTCTESLFFSPFKDLSGMNILCTCSLCDWISFIV